jgi:ribA/ribD-fused uncharacterized protein
MKLYEPGAGAIEKFTRTFLSNFWPALVVYDGETYATVEHAYQAAKTLNLDVRRSIREAPSAAAAKKKGHALRGAGLRPDWADVKLEVMEGLLRQKFAHADLRAMLLETAPKRLVEGNTWGDTYWGMVKGVGSNHLGELLMRIRAEIVASAP